MKAGLAGIKGEKKVAVGFFDLHGCFGADHIEEMEKLFPTLVPLMVFGLRRIDVSDMLAPFQEGADAVFLARCSEDRDPFPEARHKLEARVDRARFLLDSLGVNGNRIKIWDMPREGLLKKEWWDELFLKSNETKMSHAEEMH
jgi:coenzyme F420-reducing hydrogenase delta subunit